MKYSLDERRPITTAAAFDAADWLPNRHQHKWLQTAFCFSKQSKIFCDCFSVTF